MSNGLLGSLAAADLDRLRPHLQQVTLSSQQVVQAAAGPLRGAIFPESGLISVRASDGSANMEIALVGREGLIGAGLLLGQEQSAFEAVVILPGDALVISSSALRDALRASPDLHIALLSHVQTLMRDLGLTVLATGKRTVEQRVARWLCMAQDQACSDAIALTHHTLARCLGVRRPGVTGALHKLEGKHAVRSLRGRIIIRDRAQLERLAAFTGP